MYIMFILNSPQIIIPCIITTNEINQTDKETCRICSIEMNVISYFSSVNKLLCYKYYLTNSKRKYKIYRNNNVVTIYFDYIRKCNHCKATNFDEFNCNKRNIF